MTWFSLPATQPENRAAFADSSAAGVWLAQQPQANTAAMQAELIRQIEALNAFRMAARERFKTLEVMRKALFTIDGEALRRFENRPIPLWSSEQVAQDTSRRLWRACTLAYLHCLRACLDGDPGVAELKTSIVHRALICLRMEQQTCYLGALDVDPEFWRTLHAVFASAEQLGVTREPVVDRLFGETSESTVSGQYAMTLLLHLARPFELSRSQLAAATRWFARWREQAEIRPLPDDNPKARTVALDLQLDCPLAKPGFPPGTPRWLSLDAVLRKMRKRVEALKAGESPEELKLGSGMASEACVALLKTLSDNLKAPSHIVYAVAPDSPPVNVAVGMPNIHHQLGGTGLKQAEEPTSINRREQEQIAIFGQVAHAIENRDVPKPEGWLLASDSVTQEPAPGYTGGSNNLRLYRPGGRWNTRLGNRCLLAVQLPGQTRFVLVSVFSLCTHSDGSLHALARVLPGKPAPLIAEVSERPMGKISRQPAFLLQASDAAGNPPSVLLPSGVPARALGIKLRHQGQQVIKLVACIERAGDYERWSCEIGQQGA